LDRRVKTGGFGQVTSALCSQMKEIRKEHHAFSETWRRLRNVLVVLCCVWHLCRAQCNLKTSKGFWSETHCPVLEGSVSVAGHGYSNWIMTQNTQPRMDKNYSEVALSPDLNLIEHLWKELKLAVWRKGTHQT